ncbi:chlorophyll a/b-binding protein [Calothrix sp. 336/3]|uniref:chlorophyll a/b-binding protein n=1 Tax=Calothrix sp. 336/3 TaxID=1337936 RepID=UPI001EDFC882
MLHKLVFSYKVKQRNSTMTSRGFTINERGQLNNFAIEPKVYVDQTERTGFTEYAEKLNGRLAMIGFVSLIALEVLSGHGVIGLLNGL